MPGSAAARLVTGAYPLLLAFMAGCVFLDQLYAHTAITAGANNGHTIADVLLLLTLPVLALGLVAALLGAGRSRPLFALSLGVFSLELQLPALLTRLPGGVWLTHTGPLLRAAVVLGALLLACLGQRAALR